MIAAPAVADPGSTARIFRGRLQQFDGLRELARADVFDRIEMVRNRHRRHRHLDGVSPEASETA